ncbi:MAG: ABC transporter ATP-binding protein [Chlorobium sp.]|nr:MAG: ABC transporter ATP-binding protein [Chlorobium sp.]
MSDIAIRFENISKQYELGTIGTGTLSHDVNRWLAKIRGKEDPYLKIGQVNDRSIKADGDFVWALKDIDFEVKKGEVLGIIGKNGAGKSTLLKILSRVTKPTTGRITAKGRIASLLEVGTGFHPEMTGRENIHMNGSIMGMTKKEITSKFDEIVDFAGIEKFIDTPVKRYSSGMTVRLGFAIAAHLEPEILVVDEVLAVGDAEFQKKAIGKMQEVSKGHGRTVLFVSHNMGAVRQLCNKVAVLNNGMLCFNGAVEVGITSYVKNSDFTLNKIIEGLKYSNNDLELHVISINDSEDNIVYIDDNNTIDLVISGFLKKNKIINLEIRFFDDNHSLIGMYSPGHLNGISPEYKKGDFYLKYNFSLPKGLTKGQFYLTIDLTHPNVEGYCCIDKGIIIVSKGISSVTGQEFKYKECGLFVRES